MSFDNQIETQQPQHWSGTSAALALEVAKILKLVAPSGMNADSQTMWIASAVEALEGISAKEVAAVSVEIRRSVTDHRKIVPAIASLVSDRRKHAAWMRSLPPPMQTPERKIDPQAPFTREELDRMPRHIAEMGIKAGYLTRDEQGRLIETPRDREEPSNAF